MRSIRTVVIAALASVVGCAHSTPAPPPAPPAVAAPAPAPAPAPPDTAAADPDQAELDAVRAAMCACKDGACAEQVAHDHAAFAERFQHEYGGGAKRPTDAMMASLDKIRACAAALPPPPGVVDGTEADLALDRLEVEVKRYYAAHHALPVGTERPTPATTCCAGPHNQCASTPADWRTDRPGHPWAELRFSVLDDKYFQYDYQGTADELTVHAIADLDCDASNGATEYTLHARVVSGQIVIETARPSTRN